MFGFLLSAFRFRCVKLADENTKCSEPIDPEHTLSVRIPLNRRNRNHVNAMYFGVLNVGSDLAAGLLAARYAANSGVQVVPEFAGLKAVSRKSVFLPIAKA